jgi:hypothetical protein
LPNIIKHASDKHTQTIPLPLIERSGDRSDFGELAFHDAA